MLWPHVPHALGGQPAAQGKKGTSWREEELHPVLLRERVLPESLWPPF